MHKKIGYSAPLPMGIGTSTSFVASGAADFTGFVAFCNTPLNSAKPIAAATIIPATAIGALEVGRVVGGALEVG